MSEAPVILSSFDERDTRRVGECIAAGLRPAQARNAIVVAIDGELGAGKTRLVRGIAGGLGADVDRVSSPTFVLLVEHRGDGADLVHVDAWRLRSGTELDGLGWEELLGRPRTIIAVEWASKIADALPAARVHVSIDAVGSDERRITIDDSRDDASRAALRTALGLLRAPTMSGGRGEHRCPTCGRATGTDEPTFPFCSARCKMADLGRWFGGAFRVSRPAQADEELSE